MFQIDMLNKCLASPKCVYAFHLLSVEVFLLEMHFGGGDGFYCASLRTQNLLLLSFLLDLFAKAQSRAPENIFPHLRVRIIPDSSFWQ